MDRQVMKLSGNKVDSVKRFKYLKSVLQKIGGFDKVMRYRIMYGWVKWREPLNILCHKKITIQLNGKIYKIGVRPTIRMF